MVAMVVLSEVTVGFWVWPFFFLFALPLCPGRRRRHPPQPLHLLLPLPLLHERLPLLLLLPCRSPALHCRRGLPPYRRLQGSVKDALKVLFCRDDGLGALPAQPRLHGRARRRDGVRRWGECSVKIWVSVVVQRRSGRGSSEQGWLNEDWERKRRT